MPITKPPVETPWADSGTKVTPSGGLISSGYTAPGGLVPGFGVFNWILNFLMNAVRYFMLWGISAWDAAETYTVGNFVRDPVDGNLYALAIPGPAGTSPSVDSVAVGGHWLAWVTAPIETPSAWGKEIFAWRNVKKFRRFGIDKMGFQAGRIQRWSEDWGDLGFTTKSTVATATWAKRWSYSLLGDVSGADLTVAPPNNSAHFSSAAALRANMVSGSGSTSHIESTPFAMNDTGLAFAWESEVTIESNPGGNSCEFSVGLNFVSQGGFSGSATNANGGAGAFFYRPISGSSNWLLWVKAPGGSSPTPVDTGVVAGVSGRYFLRIEYMAPAMSDDGAERFNFYLDGAHVGNIAVTLGANSSLFRSFARVTGNGSNAIGAFNKGVTIVSSNLWGNDSF